MLSPSDTMAALSIRLDVLVLLVCCPVSVKTYPPPQVDPDRLQFFTYDALTVRCQSTDWRLMWTQSSHWNTTSPLHQMNIHPALPKHSGEYWCENEEGDRGEAVTITVTGGDVILDSPAAAVVEGHNLTLRCQTNTGSPQISDFYKDGVFVRTEYTGSLTIANVSQSDRGLYRCHTSRAGASAESWLQVFNHSQGLSRDSPPIPEQTADSSNRLLLLWTISATLLVFLLLLLTALLLWRKNRAFVCFSCRKSPPDRNTDSDDASLDDTEEVTYSVVQHQKNNKELHECRANIRTLPSNETVIYSSVQSRP